MALSLCHSVFEDFSLWKSSADRSPKTKMHQSWFSWFSEFVVIYLNICENGFLVLSSSTSFGAGVMRRITPPLGMSISFCFCYGLRVAAYLSNVSNPEFWRKMFLGGSIFGARHFFSSGFLVPGFYGSVVRECGSFGSPCVFEDFPLWKISTDRSPKTQMYQIWFS